ncbi:MAG: SBBP repeat-containing protein, partial [Acidobacteriota bacterium]
MKRIGSQITRLLVIALAVAGFIVNQPNPSAKTSAGSALPTPRETDKARAIENYGKLPLSFEPNQGQANLAVQFLSRGNSYTLFLTGNEAVMALRGSEKQKGFLKLKLVGANVQPQAEGQQPLEGKSNYLLGNDRSKWQADIPTYASVKYNEVWPGVDMVWYGNQRTLEYDFIVKPGVDPEQIKLMFEGAESLRLDAEGNLLLTTKAGEMTQKAPVIYQDGEQGRTNIAGKYLLKGQNEVAFEIGAYDASRPLVIDPQLLYSTYVGGNSSETAFGVAVTSNGQAFITGGTFSTNFPVTTTADPEASIDVDVAFVTKLNATGTGVIYSTILGGTCGLNGACGLQPFGGVAVTSDGKAAITGGLVNDGNKSNYPVTDNAFQKNGVACIGDCGIRNARGNDIFVTMLNAQGNGLVYSTFYGGWSVLGGFLSNEAGNGIALDSSGRIYITGLTASNNLPMKNGFQNNPNSSLGGDDAFIAVFNPLATNGNDTLVYASYLGGSGDEIGKDIAVDSAGNAYVGGETKSNDLETKAPAGQSLPPLRAAFQGGTTDGFVAKIDPDASGASSLTYLTYFGGSGTDRVESIAVDANQRAYITGATGSSSANFPLLNAFDNVQNNGEAFVSKLNADGTAIFYSSFLGGTNATSGGGGFEEGLGITIDAAGNVYVAGRTSAGAAFPVGAAAPPFPANLQGTAFIAKIEASVSTTVAPKLLYSTTFGGAGTAARDVAIDPFGNLYLTGFSDGNLPTTAGVFQPTFNGGSADAFVAKIASTFHDTIGVFRPSVADFFLRNSNDAGGANFTLRFGLTGDIPVAGDFDGDGD